ncbi:199_t:CDS:1, partial [Gigaspora margarita]
MFILLFPYYAGKTKYRNFSFLVSIDKISIYKFILTISTAADSARGTASITFGGGTGNFIGIGSIRRDTGNTIGI